MPSYMSAAAATSKRLVRNSPSPVGSTQPQYELRRADIDAAVDRAKVEGWHVELDAIAESKSMELDFVCSQVKPRAKGSTLICETLAQIYTLGTRKSIEGQEAPFLSRQPN